MTTPAGDGASELPKTYEPAKTEQLVTERWDTARAFHVEPDSPTRTGDNYSIVIPPPNVTAALHLGHALNNTLQDVL
ncbi:MAG: class I tRNA ligase family protein, partial [Acidimicrobiales bacterium]